jgi:hypothetical protein
VEAVFRPENFRIFSNDFRSVPAGKHRDLTGIYRKKSENFPARILPPCSSDFLCFPAGYVDFPASFLQDLVAGIIDLGIDQMELKKGKKSFRNKFCNPTIILTILIKMTVSRQNK